MFALIAGLIFSAAFILAFGTIAVTATAYWDKAINAMIYGPRS